MQKCTFGKSCQCCSTTFYNFEQLFESWSKSVVRQPMEIWLGSKWHINSLWMNVMWLVNALIKLQYILKTFFSFTLHFSQIVSNSLYFMNWFHYCFFMIDWFIHALMVLRKNLIYSLLQVELSFLFYIALGLSKGFKAQTWFWLEVLWVTLYKPWDSNHGTFVQCI